MSLESLANVHTVLSYIDVPSTGAGMGVNYTPTLVGSKTCRVEELTASESKRYSTDSVRVSHLVYFTTDPSLDNRHVLKFGSKFLRCRGVFIDQDGAGDSKLWICKTELDTAYQDSL